MHTDTLKIGAVDVAQFALGTVAVILLVAGYTALLYFGLRWAERHVNEKKD